MREAVIERKTAETDIRLKLELDGSGTSDVASGIGFLALRSLDSAIIISFPQSLRNTDHSVFSPI